MKSFILLMLTSFLCVQGQSQYCRYLEEVFPDVKQTDEITYGVNATILYLPVLGQAVPEQLVLDLYEPVGDTLTERPLIIVFHSGNFLPFPQNQSPVGTRKDSSVVEICRRLARSGYVVASADYRLGWNPTTPNPQELTIGLINAAYRGVQDANTCIRYFKKTVAEQDNIYRIDTSRIVLFGDDTGGYLSLNAGALDRYSKIPETPQFCIPTGPGTCFPMVVDYLSGDVEGKVYGVNTPAVPGFPFPPGDTLCYPNHVGYSSSFAASVSLSGAVGDTAWIEPGQPPVIAFHVPSDFTTPYECGTVFIRFGEQLIPVIYVCGSYAVKYKAGIVGNNSSLTPFYYSNVFQIDITDVANDRTDGIEGLMPLYGDTPTDFNPWDFWDCPSNPNCENGKDGNPNMSYEKADRYLDTIMDFVRPRLLQTLQLNPGIEEGCILIKTEDIITDEIEVNAFPNPSSGEITFTAPADFVIRYLSVFDMKGVLIHSVGAVNESYYTMETDELASGIYLMRLQFDKGIAALQFVVK